MTKHNIKINAMGDARREIGAAIRRLDKAAGILEEYEHGGRLVVIAHCLRVIDRELYEKIHPATAPKPESQP